ncbi:DNA-binding transcriptional regulator, AcrR family [Nakamurella panacisegetis]|uniref:DNA-binding transcriptional regulator, AcrR family n=1 Tax=Nakamurella panacisegetis TaxID=1090615 RepID=A0A1H0MX56_9ACTN|nr:TetR/AcrR family transcriptional regulator [Nakamurella panacisegetis]SDO84942.1 DNA-binding transcriptional regulator, AcrR family [Nakamurella panacisegetis]
MADTPTQRRTPSRRGGGEALRTEIIEAASALLAETGDVASMSLRAVARAVGIATTSIYLHFADLDELILAVKLKRFAELTECLDAAVAGAGGDPVEQVRAIGHGYVTFGLANPGHYRVMFSASTKGTILGPNGMTIGLEAFNSLVTVVSAALDRPPLDREVEIVSTNLWNFVHGIVHLRTARSTFHWPDLRAQVDDMIDRTFGLRSASQ